MSHPETLKTFFTYTIALVVLVGGGMLVRFPPPGLSPEVLLTALAGYIGTVLGFVFGERSATAASNNAGTTVNAQPPSSVTVEK
jgi:hypothetical protein